MLLVVFLSLQTEMKLRKINEKKLIDCNQPKKKLTEKKIPSSIRSSKDYRISIFSKLFFCKLKQNLIAGILVAGLGFLHELCIKSIRTNTKWGFFTDILDKLSNIFNSTYLFSFFLNATPYLFHNFLLRFVFCVVTPHLASTTMSFNNVHAVYYTERIVKWTVLDAALRMRLNP